MDARQSLVRRFRTVTGLAETTTIRDHAESNAWPVLRVGGGKEGRGVGSGVTGPLRGRCRWRGTGRDRRWQDVRAVIPGTRDEGAGMARVADSGTGKPRIRLKVSGSCADVQ